jgi:hypothetical protein
MDVPAAIVAHRLGGVHVHQFLSRCHANGITLYAGSEQALSIRKGAGKSQTRVRRRGRAGNGAKDGEWALRGLRRAHRAILRHDPSAVLLAERGSLDTASNQALDLAGSANAVVSACIRPSKSVENDGEGEGALVNLRLGDGGQADIGVHPEVRSCVLAFSEEDVNVIFATNEHANAIEWAVHIPGAMRFAHELVVHVHPDIVVGRNFEPVSARVQER